MIKHIFGVNKKQFPYLKIAMEFSKETKVDIMYTVTTLYNFIIYHYFDNEKDIYNKDDSNNKRSKDVNRNENKDNQTLPSDTVYIN